MNSIALITASARTTSARRRHRWIGALVAVACATLATTQLAATASVASPMTGTNGNEISFNLSFEGLVPGVPATQMVELSIPREAEVDSFLWLERTGILKTARFTVELCETDGHCVPSQGTAKPPLVSAGTLPVRVTVVISEYGSGTAVGELVLASEGAAGLGERSAEPFAAGHGIASTGVNIASASLWAAAALAIGCALWAWPRVILVRARRRTHEQDSVAP